eukprot:6184409-Pleurochrysis_carterae.AAC.2
MNESKATKPSAASIATAAPLAIHASGAVVAMVERCRHCQGCAERGRAGYARRVDPLRHRWRFASRWTASPLSLGTNGLSLGENTLSGSGETRSARGRDEGAGWVEVGGVSATDVGKQSRRRRHTKTEPMDTTERRCSDMRQ